MNDVSCVANPLLTTCMGCTKKKNSLFDSLSQEELEELERNRTVVSYKRGEMIYKEGSKSMGLLCLNEGKVKLVRNIKSEQIIGLRRPVDFIDLRTVVTSFSYNHSAYALEDSSVCFIEKDHFLKVMNGNPELSLKVIRMFVSDNDNSFNRLLNNAWKHLRARLAEAILNLKEFYGTLEDGQTINCYIRRSDLAGLANMNSANVIRTLVAFKDEGLLESGKKRIVIKNEETLRLIGREK